MGPLSLPALISSLQEIKDKEKETENVAPLDPSNIVNIAETDVEDSEDKSYHEFCEEVRRMNTVERIEPPKVVVRCEYTGAQGNEPRCSDPALPLAKFCLAHIMNVSSVCLNTVSTFKCAFDF